MEESLFKEPDEMTFVEPRTTKSKRILGISEVKIQIKIVHSK